MIKDWRWFYELISFPTSSWLTLQENVLLVTNFSEQKLLVTTMTNLQSKKLLVTKIVAIMNKKKY